MTALAALPCPATAAPPEQRVKRAGAFTDSVGVNVHLGYSDTPYARVDAVIERLRALGVRHVRDGLLVSRPDQWEALRRLRTAGIRSTLIMGDPRGRFGRYPSLLKIAREQLPGVIEAMEGPNEYDATVPDRSWVRPLRAYARNLRRAAKRHRATARLPVIAPSVFRSANYALLGDLRRHVRYGNIHPYPGGQAPDHKGHVRDERGLARHVARGRQVIATEAGYHNALAYRGSHRPVSERAAGIYMPRLFLEHFRYGIRRTYAYELLDEFPNPAGDEIASHFGLLRNDLSPKPAYTALKNLMAILRDDGRDARRPPPRLRLGVRGGRGLRRLVLAKRDGGVYVALWWAASVWDPFAKRALHRPTHPVALSFDCSVPRVDTFRPNAGMRPRRSVRGASSYHLRVGPAVTVLRLGATGASRGPARKALAERARLVAGELRRASRSRLARSGRLVLPPACPTDAGYAGMLRAPGNGRVLARSRPGRRIGGSVLVFTREGRRALANGRGMRARLVVTGRGTRAPARRSVRISD